MNSMRKKMESLYKDLDNDNVPPRSLEVIKLATDLMCIPQEELEEHLAEDISGATDKEIYDHICQAKELTAQVFICHDKATEILNVEEKLLEAELALTPKWIRNLIARFMSDE